SQVPRPEGLPDVEGSAVDAPGDSDQRVVFDPPELQGAAATRQKAHGDHQGTQDGEAELLCQYTPGLGTPPTPGTAADTTQRVDIDQQEQRRQDQAGCAGQHGS